jgi:hypothetical protein
MKEFLTMCVGFAASFVGALCAGFLVRMAVPATSNLAPSFQPEFAGVIALVTLWYILMHRFHRHL